MRVFNAFGLMGCVKTVAVDDLRKHVEDRLADPYLNESSAEMVLRDLLAELPLLERPHV